MKWTLLTVYKAKGRDEPLAICDRCGRELYAAAYEVALDDESQIVGSGCCEILTGHTPAQIAKNDQIREEAEASAEAELEQSLTVKRYKIANAQVIAFLERKKSEAEASYKTHTEQYKESDRYPSYNDFFENLLDHIERRGTLSEKQMAVVKRLMGRDENKPLPIVGDKIEASGTVIHLAVEIDPYSGYRDSYLVKLDIDSGGQHVRVTVREGTKLWQNLGINIGNDLTLRNAPKQLSVMGKVKYAKNGLVILTRARLI